MIRAFLNRHEAEQIGLWPLTLPYTSREYHWLADALDLLRSGNIRCELVLTADGLEIWRRGGKPNQE
jgi:hypothetical protein